ncbi:MAG TPA: DNA repair protein RecN [Actinomycetota bacterium]
MLLEVHIAGLGVIEDLDLELHPGLNVLTGETGAGKTMVTVGLALALGGRSSATLVRDGAGRMRVEARFRSPGTPATTEWTEDGEVVLARTVSADGRSSARIGGQIVPVSALAALAPDLVEVHGQNRAQRLLAPAEQTAFLDRFSGAAHPADVDRHREVFERLRRVRRRLDEIDRDEREREREKDLLAYQVREIETAGLTPGETMDLRAEESRLANAERLADRAATAERALSAEGGAAEGLASAAGALRDAAAVDPGARELSDRLTAVAEEAADVARDVREWRERVRADPARLAEVNERLQALGQLERKYGEGEEGVLAYLDQARTRLAALEGTGEERAALDAEAAALEGERQVLAGGITAAREAAAPRLAAAIEAELQELGMQGATVTVAVRASVEPTSMGAERAEMLFSGGSGQTPLPLGKAASGGELSRTMLACRSVLADLDRVPTLVFDEVDAGIGGRAGLAVGRRLARLADSRQVLVVTHLPQIACFADRHLRVVKRGGVATVEVLDDSERVAEISRMLSGLPDSEAAATHAEELLAQAAAET